MAGILDKNTRVVDMILTMEGKKLLAKGELQFVYFCLFDDEIDYDPYVANSGSLSAEQLSGTVSLFTEECLVREAVSGYVGGANSSSFDFTNFQRPLFTMKQGSPFVPRLTVVTASNTTQGTLPNSADLEVVQQKKQEIYIKRDQNGNVIQQQGPFDRGYERKNSQVVGFEMQLWPPEAAVDMQHQKGVMVRVYQTGSSGPIEVEEKRDSRNRLTYNNDFVLNVGTSPGNRRDGRS